MTEGFEILKIFAIGLVLVFGIYFLSEMSVNLGIPEVQADIATTSVTVGNVAPTVSNVSLNGGAAITLSENTTVTVTCAGTLTDQNGGSDISYATATIFRSGVGTGCTADDNNCYQVASSSCTLGTAVGNDRPATCTAEIWFHADPTDVGSPWETEVWDCNLTAVDAAGASGSATTTTPVELNTLNALDVTATIGYGTLAPGQTIDPLNVTTTATTTGNAAIDANISGTDMCTDYPTCAGNTIAIGQQHYATTTGTAYASGYVASTTAQTLELDTGKPTAHPSNQQQDVYWGIAIPAGQPTGDYTGENTYTAVAD